MKDEPQFTAGQELISDIDFRYAKSRKIPIMVYRDGMRLRPPAAVIAFQDNSVRIADGTIFLRSVSTFFTLSEEEKLKYNLN